jgi:hypothetical protein
MGLLQDRDFFDVLIDLNKRLNTYSGTVEGTNIIERYAHFITSSDKGKNCGYARRYRELFITHDWDDISRLILEAADTIRDINGDTDKWQNRRTTTGTVTLPPSPETPESLLYPEPEE